MPADVQTHTRVMSITHAEFLRSLLPLKKYYQYKIDDNGKLILISDEQRVVKIRLGKEGRTVIGSLQMPSTQVELTFSGFTPPDMDLFWSRFDLCFRRGGG
jgi:hypothetical protein